MNNFIHSNFCNAIQIQAEPIDVHPRRVVQQYFGQKTAFSGLFSRCKMFDSSELERSEHQLQVFSR